MLLQSAAAAVPVSNGGNFSDLAVDEESLHKFETGKVGESERVNKTTTLLLENAKNDSENTARTSTKVKAQNATEKAVFTLETRSNSSSKGILDFDLVHPNVTLESKDEEISQVSTTLKPPNATESDPNSSGSKIEEQRNNFTKLNPYKNVTKIISKNITLLAPTSKKDFDLLHQNDTAKNSPGSSSFNITKEGPDVVVSIDPNSMNKFAWENEDESSSSKVFGAVNSTLSHGSMMKKKLEELPKDDGKMKTLQLVAKDHDAAGNDVVAHNEVDDDALVESPLSKEELSMYNASSSSGLNFNETIKTEEGAPLNSSGLFNHSEELLNATSHGSMKKNLEAKELPKDDGKMKTLQLVAKDHDAAGNDVVAHNEVDDDGFVESPLSKDELSMSNASSSSGLDFNETIKTEEEGPLNSSGLFNHSEELLNATSHGSMKKNLEAKELPKDDGKMKTVQRVEKDYDAAGNDVVAHNKVDNDAFVESPLSKDELSVNNASLSSGLDFNETIKTEEEAPLNSSGLFNQELPNAEEDLSTSENFQSSNIASLADSSSTDYVNFAKNSTTRRTISYSEKNESSSEVEKIETQLSGNNNSSANSKDIVIANDPKKLSRGGKSTEKTLSKEMSYVEMMQNFEVLYSDMMKKMKNMEGNKTLSENIKSTMEPSTQLLIIVLPIIGGVVVISILLIVFFICIKNFRKKKRSGKNLDEMEMVIPKTVEELGLDNLGFEEEGSMTSLVSNEMDQNLSNAFRQRLGLNPLYQPNEDNIQEEVGQIDNPAFEHEEDDSISSLQNLRGCSDAAETSTETPAPKSSEDSSNNSSRSNNVSDGSVFSDDVDLVLSDEAFTKFLRDHTFAISPDDPLVEKYLGKKTTTTKPPSSSDSKKTSNPISEKKRNKRKKSH